MKNEDAAKILEALAKGIDPETGDFFPEDSALNSPHVIRALFLGAKELQSAPRKGDSEKRAIKVGLEHAGKPWSEEEEQQLVEAFERGDSVQVIAEAHQRKPGGITSRLVKLGHIERPSSGASDV